MLKLMLIWLKTDFFFSKLQSVKIHQMKRLKIVHQNAVLHLDFVAVMVHVLMKNHAVMVTLIVSDK